MAHGYGLRLEFVEQPERFLRFRYVSEERVGKIRGISSTREQPTYVAIRVVGPNGNEKILVVLSLVTEEHFAHPHQLTDINRTNPDIVRFKNGIYKNHIHRSTNTLVLSNLGMQCVRRDDAEIRESLRLRDESRVHPFENRHNDVDPNSFNLNVVRLCVQGFIVLADGSRLLFDTIVSEPIINTSLPDLRIARLSHASVGANERGEITLLCGKVNKKEDIVAEFINPVTGWRDQGIIVTVHKHVAVVVNTPAYHDLDVSEPVPVNIRLSVPGMNLDGPSVPFRFTPSEPEYRRRKRFRSIDLNELSQWNTNPQLDLSNVPILPYPLPQNQYSVQGSYPVNDDIDGLSAELSTLVNLSPMLPQADSNASAMPYYEETPILQPDAGESNNANSSSEPFSREPNSEEIVTLNDSLPNEIMSPLIYTTKF